MLHAYKEIQTMFSGKHASARVAEMVSEMAGWEK
jgi:hypothetical protein